MVSVINTVLNIFPACNFVLGYAFFFHWFFYCYPNISVFDWLNKQSLNEVDLLKKWIAVLLCNYTSWTKNLIFVFLCCLSPDTHFLQGIRVTFLFVFHLTPIECILQGIRPTATILLRGPTGRTSWTVELRQIPDCKKVSVRPRPV